MHPHGLRREAADLSWKARLASLRNVRPLLRLVWETSPPLLCATAFLRVLRALLPVAMLWVSKLILDAVVRRLMRKNGDLEQIWKLVALELGLAILSDVLGRAKGLCDSVLNDQIGRASCRERV